MSDFLSAYQMDVTKAGRSTSEISPLAKILAVLTGRWFEMYGAQQKDDRESATKRMDDLDKRLKGLEKANRGDIA